MSELHIPDGTVDGSRRQLLKGVGLGGLAAGVLAACGGATKSSDNGGHGSFPKTPKFKFAFINHVTTNQFFVPTQYGAQDACDLIGASFTWQGSVTGAVNEMV